MYNTFWVLCLLKSISLLNHTTDINNKTENNYVKIHQRKKGGAHVAFITHIGPTNPPLWEVPDLGGYHMNSMYLMQSIGKPPETSWLISVIK